MTVADLLELGGFRKARLLAGKAGLGAPVEGVDVIEIPHFGPWVRPRTVYISCLWAFRDGKVDLGAVVRTLKERGASALVIELGEAFDRVPDDMVAAAEEAGLPLLVVPPDVGNADLMVPVMEELFNRRLWARAPFLDLRQRVLLELGDSRSPASFVRGLTRTIGTLIAWALPTGEYLVESPSGGADHLLRVWEAVRTEVLAKARKGQPLVVTPAGDEPAPAGPGCEAVVLPVGGSPSAGALISVCDKPHQPWQLAVLDQGAALAALLWGRACLGFARVFWRDLMAGRIRDEELQLRARIAGLSPRLPRVGIAIGCLEAKDGESGRPGRSLGRAARAVLAALAPEAWTSVSGSEVHALLPVEQGGKGHAPGLCCLLQEFHRAVAERLGSRVAVGVGSVTAAARDMRRTVSEAREALRVARATDRPGVVFFDECFIERVLVTHSAEALDRVWARTLGRLEALAGSRAPQLLHTLELSVRAGSTVRTVAKSLSVHPNTVRYRLERIRRLLGYDPLGPDRRLETEIALKIGVLKRVLRAL